VKKTVIVPLLLNKNMKLKAFDLPEDKVIAHLKKNLQNLPEVLAAVDKGVSWD